MTDEPEHRRKTKDERHCVRDLVIDGALPPPIHPDAEKERRIAVYEFIENNSFRPHKAEDGPYRLTIAVNGSRLTLSVALLDGRLQCEHHLSLSPLRSHLKDYGVVCAGYYDSIRNAPQSRIEALDMGRRSLHDDASQKLIERLKGKIDVDFETARRLFTLIFALRNRL